MSRKVPIIIPAYEPDDRMIELLEKIKKDNFIIIVDDGSESQYQTIFDKAVSVLGDNGVILKHEVNKGKGRALKTAFQYIINEVPEAIGVVTADSDGQHTKEDIQRISEALYNNPDSFIMGVRKFNREEIPWKSWVGNMLFINAFKFFAGMEISDTQTGLRGIPREFVKELINVRGERFEYETEMILSSRNKYPIVEVAIKTVYDSKENHQTHYRPLMDTAKIYFIIARHFERFILASGASFALDLLMFHFMCKVFVAYSPSLYIMMATVGARIISSLFNFNVNYKLVFNSNEKLFDALKRYVLLAVVIMITSASLTTLLCGIVHPESEVICKMIVDFSLFFVSYKIQHSKVYNRGNAQTIEA